MRVKRLKTIVRIRKVGVEEAQREVAQCLQSETAAEARCTEWERTIWRETEAAVDMEAGDARVDSFVRWSGKARLQMTEANERLEQARAATATARARLAMAQAGLNVLERQYEQEVARETAEGEAKSLQQISEQARTRTR